MKLDESDLRKMPVCPQCWMMLQGPIRRLIQITPTLLCPSISLIIVNETSWLWSIILQPISVPSYFSTSHMQCLLMEQEHKHNSEHVTFFRVYLKGHFHLKFRTFSNNFLQARHEAKFRL